ncbi:aminotransferase class I and II [Kitasatospora sp. NBC_01287]|uniref:HipA family kinase n=1 Tax=Kitasatospora sp. NBC_01287 TaxID=2903573 RepID=UPI00225AF729|nr:HipA family kinase [Kitasatospora sp. NBC_01287]MCX4750806.1 aminotransferase class I and II [Kitasatospora sp. NBC_01287]
MLREVTAVRYVTPLREGGSMPGLVAADDHRLYALKWSGAAQGRKALVAEVLAGELARGLGLPVPELVRIDLDPVLARSEPEQQIQEQIRASGGVNVGLAFLSGAFNFDPLCFEVDPEQAARVLWFDALIGNVDRSWRNPNLLVVDGRLQLIDHGASLIFHHHWAGAARWTRRPYDAGDHALRRFAGDLAAADAELAGRATPGLLAAAAEAIPEEFLLDEPGFADPAAVRAAYVDQLLARLAGPRDWLPVLPPHSPEATA